MRLIGRFAASLWLSACLAGPAALGVSLLVSATAAPAALAAASVEGDATATASPSTTTPGTIVTFQVTCASNDNVSATLFGTTLGLPGQIPMNEVSAGTGEFAVTVTLPSDIQPGSYHPDIDCSDGSSATAALTVTALPAEGGAQTGDGTTSTQTNDGLARIGLAMIAVGAVIGGIGMRRRGSAHRR
ncbi:MAG TPA: hypothetical protein VEL03_19970 [Streptosporangiaceae bacterium]|nr:hypothetical protein [Streptosporangiaceae bacterium]